VFPTAICEMNLLMNKVVLNNYVKIDNVLVLKSSVIHRKYRSEDGQVVITVETPQTSLYSYVVTVSTWESLLKTIAGRWLI
jgi:hypothetical protein